jgi:hypothetical protein
VVLLCYVIDTVHWYAVFSVWWYYCAM